MRFHWVAREINQGTTLRYELFKPWRHYDAVVFLKSMGDQCERLMDKMQKSGTRGIFEANVDYYTRATCANLPGELAPTEAQRTTATAMTQNSDGVIASSRRLSEICKNYAIHVYPVTDHIPPGMIPKGNPGNVKLDGRIQIWWSGMPAKLYDFLLISNVLEAQSKNLHLHFVTGDAEAAISSWPEESIRKFRALLDTVPHTFHKFRGVPDLLRLYHSQGGVIISPRYLDSPYNHSHSEWKLTLGLACGLCGIGSPLPSYEDAAKTAGNEKALRICRTNQDWGAAFEEIISDPEMAWQSGVAGAVPILKTYGTPRVAGLHAQAVMNILDLKT